MVIVKMNNTTVECSIAASELREIGLTPEAIMNGEKKTVPFMAQLNREVGEQLGYNPETEVLMMSKNMMMDGSVRIFAIKMSNEDIQKSADRIRGSAEAILREMTQERVDSIKAKTGFDKGQALNEMIGHVSELIEQIYDQDEEQDPQIEAMAKPIVNTEKYMARFKDINSAARFAKVSYSLPITGSKLYKENDEYFVTLVLEPDGENAVYDLRRCGLEYAEELMMNSPEQTHVEETAKCIIKEDALLHLKDMLAK
ncbi:MULTISPECIES: adaptor protein MecA [unclassified Butyrivibrio]|uniref:adaptor protein MecA n=1 Tax=unclassified Butyrivibrio TaxID=2639466 RepID=UPI0003B569E2|nr:MULTISPECIES: adaptor protein MecA [unclassified Butyrivibrio]SDB41507.1 Negative regulator of genetic competence, sporulation and motility [Butyrivibrio sp. INlla16]SEL56817.1 Negative regulator of genetic competence, sporulation and motility [Butyrivibrio sp. ob235]